MTYCYYAGPAFGTVPVPNPTGMPTAPVVQTGEVRDMVVACDLGRAVVGIVGGVEAWRKSYPSTWPRALDVFEGLAFIGVGTSIQVVNSRTGFVHRTITVPGAPASINGLSISRWGSNIWVSLCYDMNGIGSVRGYTMNNLDLTEAFVNPFPAGYPRSAVVEGGWMFIADTFGHRVYGVDIPTLGMRNSTDVFYPNHVQMLASNRALICAEHENRVFEWKYSPTVVRTMVLCAPVAPFNDITKTKADIIAGEGATMNPSSAFTPPKSLCAVEGSGVNTLYSPNSARQYVTDILVADTDNQRVIVSRGGVVVTEVTGFNNPVTAVLV